jgi:hypothetical protein
MDDVTQHSNKKLSTILRNPSHPMHSAAKAERDRRMAQREDKDLDEISLKDLSKKISRSSGNKNINKAMKPTFDKTKNDLAAMRKRLDALKAGYAAESVELEEGVIDQVKDIVANKQAKKISGVMVDMFTASAISQIYDKVNDANKAKMDKLPIVKLADVAMKMMKRESTVSEAKQVLAHGGKGQYKIVSDGGAISVMFKGKVVGKGDFDRGADSFFISMKGQKGQKSFDDAQDIADYFAKMKIKEEVQIDEISGKLYNKALAGRKDKIDRTRNSASANALRMNKPEMKKDLKKADDMQRKLDKMKQMGIDRTARNLRKEETQLEAAPKMKGDWLKKERERNREHDAAMGRTATGRKKPTRTMTSTQKSLASLRKEMKEAFEPHMMYDPKTGKGYKAEKEADHLRMKKMGYTHDKPEVNEKYKIMHKTMSAALQHAYDEAEKKGFEVDKDDIDNKVAMGPRKPSSGKTNSYNLGLSKNGKPVKKKLHIQVYNMDNKGYELNMYVS